MKKWSIFDGHCDTAVELWLGGHALFDAPLMVSVKQAANYHGYVQTFAFCTAWLGKEFAGRDALSESLSYFENQLSQNAAVIQPVRTAPEIERMLHGGGRGALLSIEGAEAIDCDPGKLEAAYQRGVRMVSLTWNHRNALGGSCVTGEGLTPLGREFVRRAQRLGMVVDVSHLSDRGFWDVCEIAEKPIVASHSNSRAVCDHPRNLTDEMFRAICALGGTAGVNLYAPFLKAGAAATFDDVYRHIDHFLELGGEGHVALGGDLDGCDELPEGFSGIQDYEKLGEFLCLRGYADQVIQEIFSDSLLKVVKQCVM